MAARYLERQSAPGPCPCREASLTTHRPAVFLLLMVGWMTRTRFAFSSTNFHHRIWQRTAPPQARQAHGTKIHSRGDETRRDGHQKLRGTRKQTSTGPVLTHGVWVGRFAIQYTEFSGVVHYRPPPFPPFFVFSHFAFASHFSVFFLPSSPARIGLGFLQSGIGQRRIWINTTTIA